MFSAAYENRVWIPSESKVVRSQDVVFKAKVIGIKDEDEIKRETDILVITVPGRSSLFKIDDNTRAVAADVNATDTLMVLRNDTAETTYLLHDVEDIGCEEVAECHANALSLPMESNNQKDIQ
ncbi:hypothetical protein FQR65_LT00621 [Abscondita terminalis]|nr:hypothetical protein FQR65_LT00621 [Abscondita terminalis]